MSHIFLCGTPEVGLIFADFKRWNRRPNGSCRHELEYQMSKSIVKASPLVTYTSLSTNKNASRVSGAMQSQILETLRDTVHFRLWIERPALFLSPSTQ